MNSRLMQPLPQRSVPDLEEEDAGFDPRKIISFLWRRWKFLIGTAALIFTISLLYLSKQTPIYTATAQILLDPTQTKLFREEQQVQSETNWDFSYIENQLAIITSPALLRRVVQREHLLSDPEFGGGDPQPSAGDNGAKKTNDKTAPDPPASAIDERTMAAVNALQGGLKVTRVGQAYIINVAFSSSDPTKAARLANAVAEGYVLDTLDSRLEAAGRASSWFSDRLVDLRKQLRDAEEAVAQFRMKNNLVEGNKGGTLTQEQAGQLNMTMLAARAETAEKKAQLDLLRKVMASGGDLSSLPAIAASPQIEELRNRAAELSRQAAELRTRYSDKHPSVVNLVAQAQDVRRHISAELSRAAAKIDSEYQLAKARQEAAEKTLKEATGQVGLDASKAITLRELERTAAVNKTMFEDFLQRSRVTSEQSKFEQRNARVIAPAQVPGAPSAPKKAQIMIMGLILGLAVGVGGAFALEWLNAGFTSPRELEEKLELPVLASLPAMSDTDLTMNGVRVSLPSLPLLKPMSRFSEAVRAVRSGVQMTNVDRPPRVLQVCSTVPSEGKTTLALSLATSLAQGGGRALFIDCDLRHPSGSRFFGIEKQKGLVDYLVGEAQLRDAIRYDEKYRCWILGAGGKTQNPPDLLASQRMRELVEQCRSQFDLVILDAPPVAPVVDATLVARYLADEVVYVVRWASTSREAVVREVRRLSGQARVAGVVFNAVDESQAKKYGGGYDSYYGGSSDYAKYYVE